ncbi:hypothetical protein ACS0TY_013812 [Phlomoides rotata]
MIIDPIEDEVPDNRNDVVEPVDGFIDQVESSQTYMYYLLILTTVTFPITYFKMDGNSSTPRGSRGRKRVGSTSRRVWTFAEECELMNALEDLVVKGNKCDNGFRSGYLLLLENSLVTKFPGCDLKAEPHINSKIHVWKR